MKISLLYLQIFPAVFGVVNQQKTLRISQKNHKSRNPLEILRLRLFLTALVSEMGFYLTSVWMFTQTDTSG
jgi:hypothetical protein